MNLHNKIKSLKYDDVDILLKKVWPEIFLQDIISLKDLGDMLRYLEESDFLREYYLDRINSHLLKKRSLLIEDYKSFTHKHNNIAHSIFVHCINSKTNGNGLF